MKAIEKLFVAAVSVLCLAFVSCSQKEDVTNEYTPSRWMGEYPIQIASATAGTLEDHTALMELYFLDNGKEGWIIIGGPYVSARSEYEVRWSSGNQFAFYSSAGDQSLLCYSGTISGTEMTLKALNCDSVAATYKLSRLLPRE